MGDQNPSTAEIPLLFEVSRIDLLCLTDFGRARADKVATLCSDKKVKLGVI